MAGVFKSLDASDVRITPFRAYKAFSGADSYTTYSLQLSATPTELGNDALDSDATLYTTNGVLKDSAWRSTNHLFYQNYYDNTKASFGPYNFVNQPRLLSNIAYVLSMPQRYIGEGIAPNTLEVSIDGNVYVNDLYNNLVKRDGRWYAGGEVSASSVVFATKPSRVAREYDQTVNYTFASASALSYATDQYPSEVQVEKCQVQYSSTQGTMLKLQQSSSIVIKPNAEEYNRAFNFIGRDFSIAASFDVSSVTGDCVLLQKYEPSNTWRVTENGEVATQPLRNYPYKLTYRQSDGYLVFEKTDGFTTMSFSSSAAYSSNEVFLLARSGSTFYLGSDPSNLATATDTFVSGGVDQHCANPSPIYIGSSYTKTTANLLVGNVSFFDECLTDNQLRSLQSSVVLNNPYATVGNVFPQHGMVVITSPTLAATATSDGVGDVQYRGTTTIYENEISCTISPGEFGFSGNPTLQKYNPTTNQYELTDFATGSAFRPYISQIGLYNDKGSLVVAGKLSQPIRLPNNVDTTIIVKFDR